MNQKLKSAISLITFAIVFLLSGYGIKVNAEECVSIDYFSYFAKEEYRHLFYYSVTDTQGCYRIEYSPEYKKNFLPIINYDYSEKELEGTELPYRDPDTAYNIFILLSGEGYSIIGRENANVFFNAYADSKNIIVPVNDTLTLSGTEPDGTFNYSFVAIGRGIKNSSPSDGDTRCVPYEWKAFDSDGKKLSSGSFDDNEFFYQEFPVRADMFTDIQIKLHSRTINHLYVDYMVEKNEGGEWIPTGELEHSQFNFSVYVYYYGGGYGSEQEGAICEKLFEFADYTISSDYYIAQQILINPYSDFEELGLYYGDLDYFFRPSRWKLTDTETGKSVSGETEYISEDYYVNLSTDDLREITGFENVFSHNLELEVTFDKVLKQNDYSWIADPNGRSVTYSRDIYYSVGMNNSFESSLIKPESDEFNAGSPESDRIKVYAVAAIAVVIIFIIIIIKAKKKRIANS